ncbi:GDSL-type esterase/lipase family protein [Arthrobacter sp. MPF02]|uniref:GDSL-type esterase/lipase family protein n=1 Tax=Arthrobacter sp. MPF02 TaxID=3388492 RepID=UPI0039854CCB
MGKVARFLAMLVLPALVMVAAAPTPQVGRDGYPRSIAALGDSITRANNACCGPGDRPDQSWSTGSGADDGVISHYERLLQFSPGIRGQNFNYAVSGARVSDLPRQAAAAAAQQAEYVTVLAGANDLCAASAGSMTAVGDFQASVDEALAILDRMRPRPLVFVSSIPNLYRLWEVLQDDPDARAAWSAGICPSMLAGSNTEEMRRQVVERQLAFNAVLAETCAGYVRCRHDGGAVYAHTFVAGDISSLDYFHPGVSGQALLAGITWNAAWQR